MIINRVEEVLEAANLNLPPERQFYLGEESLSAKGLIDSLASEDAQKSYRKLNGTKTEEIVIFHSLIGLVPELGTFMPEYDTRMVSILNDLFNCRKHFRDRIRGGVQKGQKVEITNPHISFLFGTQPETLMEIFPEQAFRMGLFARTLIVYADKPVVDDFWEEAGTPPKTALWKKIVNDVRSITELAGEMSVAEEVRQALNHFHKVDAAKTELDSSRFTDYNVRRSLHLHKLAMVHSVSRSNSMVITLEDVDTAKNLMLAFEKQMPATFSGLVTSQGFHNTVDEIVAGRQGQKITMRDIERKLRRNHKAFEIGNIIKSMLNTRDLIPLDSKDSSGMPLYEISGKYEDIL